MKYLLILLTLAVSNAEAQYSLALNLEKGNQYSFTIHSTNHFTGEMNGQKMAMISTMNGVMKFKVTKASGTEYELEASYDTLHITMKSPMGKMEFSSGNASGDNEEAAGPLNMMTNKHFNITLLKNGSISKIETPDTVGFSSMMKNFPMLQGMKQMFMMGPMKQSFSKEAMKENMEKMTAIFPNKKVGINDTWGTEILPDSNMNHSVKITYQLVSYQGGIATIKGHRESIAKSSDKQAPGFGMMMMFPVKYELDGESESVFQVDTRSGWIKDASIKENVKGHVQMQNPNDKEAKNTPIEMEGMVSISSK